jgi:hypothetical protein
MPMGRLNCTLAITALLTGAMPSATENLDKFGFFYEYLNLLQLSFQARVFQNQPPKG